MTEHRSSTDATRYALRFPDFVTYSMGELVNTELLD